MRAYLSDLADISEADNGAYALELCGKLPPDIVFLDLMLPKISGVNIAKRLRRLHVPVVVVTAADDLDMITRALGWGAVGFLAKPFDIASARATLFVALETVRRLRAVGLRGVTGKLIHEAAGILERHSNFISRGTAIEHMRHIAKAKGITLVTYAQQVIQASSLLNGAERDEDDSQEDLGF